MNTWKGTYLVPTYEMYFYFQIYLEPTMSTANVPLMMDVEVHILCGFKMALKIGLFYNRFALDYYFCLGRLGSSSATLC